MGFTECNVPTDVIGNLGTSVAERGLTTQQFKDKFDEMPEGIINYLNNTLIPELNAAVPVIESGTFTPTIAGESTAGSNTYSIQDGKYYLIGKLCKFDILIVMTAKDAAMSGRVIIKGLPFTAKNDTNRRTACSIGLLNYFSLDPTRTIVTAWILPNKNYINLINNGNNQNFEYVTASQITATTNIIISGEYVIA